MTARYLKLLLLVVAFLVQGCAARRPVPQPAAPAAKDPDNVFVLLPDVDGHVGRIIVSNAQGSQDLKEAMAATQVASASQAPSAPSQMDQSQIARIFGEALSAHRR